MPARRSGFLTKTFEAAELAAPWTGNLRGPSASRIRRDGLRGRWRRAGGADVGHRSRAARCSVGPASRRRGGRAHRRGRGILVGSPKGSSSPSGLSSPSGSPSPTAITSLPAMADVPFYRVDAHRSSIYPGPGPVAEPQVAWQVQLDASADFVPIVVDGKVIVGDSSGILHALDARTGLEEWRLLDGWWSQRAPARPLIEHERVRTLQASRGACRGRADSHPEHGCRRLYGTALGIRRRPGGTPRARRQRATRPTP
jgi:hypothetical protein